jgi:hypothetical protein
MKETTVNRLMAKNPLLEELNDYELSKCIGGCDITFTLGSTSVAVPMVELPLLDETSVGLSVGNLSISITYDPNGSERYWAGQPIGGKRRT